MSKRTKSLKYKLGLFFIFCTVFFDAYLSPKVDISFAESFIKSYDLSGKFNHEYHPALLAETRESFLKLETALKNSGFSLDGHMLIMGYQEDAIPSYYTDCNKVAINDEAVVKTAQGITPPDKNIFGYMTGFLLKDVSYIQKRLGYTQTIIHCGQEDIQLFDDHALILQKHAFGDVSEALFAFRDQIEFESISQEVRPVISELLKFWEHLYLKSIDNKFYNVVATQDILFSIDYARALLEGKTPLKKMFIGPDITYPIEVSSIQEKEATIHAQKFIERFVSELTAKNEVKRAYIFCSFVDGVGKSTLLNNISNYQKHGSAYERYERGDNSSSQEATVYSFSDNVVLVDLPGQVSHFTTKPQGEVYSDTLMSGMSSLEKLKLFAFVNKEKNVLIQKHVQGDWPEESPEGLFLKNIKLMELENNQWVPFEYNGGHFLFHKANQKEIRVLVPLERVHSKGLKSIEPEMMILSRGISLPMSLEAFYADLIEKLQRAGVQDVVFVDFMSMYPRTSRENIRLNFIMNQLRELFQGRFPVDHNFFKAFVHQDQEVYYMLSHHFKSAQEALVLEAVMRSALHDIAVSSDGYGVHMLQGIQLRELLSEKCDALLSQHYDYLSQLVSDKLKDELVFRHKKFSLDRVYHTLISHSFEDLIAFSDELIEIFSHTIAHDYFKSLWAGLDAPLDASVLNHRLPDGSCNLGGVPMKIMYNFDWNCKDQVLLEPACNRIRAQWYASLENLLHCYKAEDGSVQVKKLAQPVPPLIVKRGQDGRVYVLQRVLPPLDVREKRMIPPAKYHIFDQQNSRPWGVYKSIAHCLDWAVPTTGMGIFAFGYNPFDQIKSSITLIHEFYLQDMHKKGLSDVFLPTSEIIKMIVQNRLWPLITKEVELMREGPRTLISAGDSSIPMIRLWSRMVSTLETVVKDAQAVVGVRKGKKDDFGACLKLLECVTLPLYYGIKVQEPLFADYNQVKACI